MKNADSPDGLPAEATSRLSRREFLAKTTAACALGILGSQMGYTAATSIPGLATSAGHPDFRNLSLAELQKRFPNPKRHLAAYEYFTAGRGHGTATLTGPAQVTVGQCVPEWTLHYQASAKGIRPGGYLRFWLPNGTSQLSLEPKKGASSVAVSAETAPVEAAIESPAFLKQYGITAPAVNRIVRVALPRGLPAGGVVDLKWTDITVGNGAPRWGENRLIFRVYADDDADGFDEEIAHSPSVALQSETASRLLLRCASTSVVGEPMRLTIAALDRFDNPAADYTGTVELSVDEGPTDGVHFPEPWRCSGTGEPCTSLSATFTRPGIYWLKATDLEGHSTLANPVEVFAEAPAERLYWGDIHFHTDYSADARAGAVSTTDYAGAYKMGRQRFGLDFMAASDHHSVEQGNYGPEDWKVMQSITNAANDPGHFVALLAVELSCPQGDQIAYFAGDSAPFFDHTAESDERKKDWATMERSGQDCFAVPHHFCQDMRPWDWTVFNPELQPLCEVFSNHGRAEFHDNQPSFCPHGIATLPERTWTEQLALDRELGVIASSDDHAGRPGCCGLAAVWAPELTRHSIHAALKNRRCYASTDSRTILHFSADSHAMGESFSATQPPVFRLRAAAPTRIREVVLVKNGQPVHQTAPSKRFEEWEWTDAQFTETASYYVRLRLDPNPDCTSRAYRGDLEEFVWSSPIWIKQPAAA